jgi:two-component system sensor histidine kinase UhpB
VTESLEDAARELRRIRAANARLLERLAETERRFRGIARGSMRLQEEERSRIARDLHDGVGQTITALKIQLALAAQDSESPPTSPLALAQTLAEQCLTEVRQLSHLLRPPMLDELGLGPTLHWLARTLPERTGLSVTLEADLPEERLAPELETLVFRVVQEALTNVVRHAGVGAARVEVRCGRETLALRVEDQGRGFDAERVLKSGETEEGFGVRAMRERVHAFGGRFTVTSGAGGTTVEARLPLPERP